MPNFKINKQNKSTLTLPNLDESVIAALDFFQTEKSVFPKNLFQNLPIIIGSGNAYNTAQVIFNDIPAIFASESNFQIIIKKYQKLIKKGLITEALIISASGEKDSVWELKLAKKMGLNTILFTHTKNSSATKLADKVYIFKKLPEPYTYNVSTYLGIMLAKDKKLAKEISSFIKSLSFPKNFAKYKAYSFILPNEISAIAPMLEIKRHELFGPHLSIRAFSEGEARHAKFVIPWDEELVISLGDNKFFGQSAHRWEIKNNKKFSNSLAMALCYFIIGKIQTSKPPYFKKNINEYCAQGSLAYNKEKEFSVIVS